jgi:hypothetical protein
MHAASQLLAGLCITTYADLNTLERVGTCYDWVSESGYVQSVLCIQSVNK